METKNSSEIGFTYSAKAAFLRTALTGSEFGIDEAKTFGESGFTRSVTNGSNIPKISSLN